MLERPHYRTVVISDVHIGAPHSKVKEAAEFLSSVDCDRLIMRISGLLSILLSFMS